MEIRVGNIAPDRAEPFPRMTVFIRTRASPDKRRWISALAFCRTRISFEIAHTGNNGIDNVNTNLTASRAFNQPRNRFRELGCWSFAGEVPKTLDWLPAYLSFDQGYPTNGRRALFSWQTSLNVHSTSFRER
ncbi:hypothetical protein BDV09DRAFT_165209 [Aspergillus tetrazonus]